MTGQEQYKKDMYKDSSRMNLTRGKDIWLYHFKLYKL